MAIKPAKRSWEEFQTAKANLQDDEEHQPKDGGPSLEEFVKSMHGQADTPQSNMPSLEWLKGQFSTKSAAIRFLINQGHEVKHIAKHLGVRYQQVRNVSKNPLKRGPNEDWRKPLLNANGEPQTFQIPNNSKPVDI